MAKYRKKPIIVEAKQLTEETLERIAAWCDGAVKGTKLPRRERVIDIQTLEGEMRAFIGDWVIRGIAGEFCPCKPDIFEVTYELVVD